MGDYFSREPEPYGDVGVIRNGYLISHEVDRHGDQV